MLSKACLAVISAVALLCGVAEAEPEPAKAPPRFTMAEEVIIARNDVLSALLRIDPRGVRTVLDAIAAAKKLPADKSGPGNTRDVFGDPKLRDGDFRVDPNKNPDLKILFQRASPEAAYDLFQILKRVGSRAPAN
ncbi:MAG: hypothetical protein ACRECO_07635 [Xanthobacteraceae bacterium]